MTNQTARFQADVKLSTSDSTVFSKEAIGQMEGCEVPLSVGFNRLIGTAKLHVEGDRVIASCVIEEVDELAAVRMSLLGNVSITDVCKFDLGGEVFEHGVVDGVRIITKFKAHEVSVGLRPARKKIDGVF